MINISQTTEELFKQDDLALAAAQRGWLNVSAYARHIQPQIQKILLKDVSEGSIVTALSRIIVSLPLQSVEYSDLIHRLAVHANLEGISYERSDRLSDRIREIYHRIEPGNKAFVTVTQGINEITIVAEPGIARLFREELASAPRVYFKANLVGITAKFGLHHLEAPNLIFALTRRLAYKNVNLVEIVSTATELTFIIDKQDLAIALEQLQKDI